MVLSQYGTESFVSVWYCHYTDSGNFQKTLNANLLKDSAYHFQHSLIFEGKAWSQAL